jgi:hypothetical protein
VNSCVIQTDSQGKECAVFESEGETFSVGTL